MKFKPEQYDAIVLILENEARFYARYTASAENTYGKRRQVISNALGYSGGPGFVRGLPYYSINADIEDRDQIRRYFDDRYEIKQTEINTYAHIPNWWLVAELLSNDIAPIPFQPSTAEKDLRVFLADVKVLCDEVAGIPFDLTNNPSVFNATTPQEPIMAEPIVITTKTYVGETDIAQLSDSTIYDMIAAEEKAIKELSAIEAKPKRLVAEIEKRQAGIAALVAHLDSKE